MARLSGSVLCFLDMPLLFEKGYDRYCDTVWCVWIPEDLQLELHNTGIINIFGGSELIELLLELNGAYLAAHILVLVIFLGIFNVYVNNVEPAAGGRAVRRSRFRIGGISGMNRINAYEAGSVVSQILDELCQIGKIADTPVSGAAESIELHAGAPYL